ncbi:YbjN domain-containing protein [Sphingobium aromaticiconvertens]|uniref:YbjN domain-containing protein n=1 Tax=Sphingobium aromaticiconvertens TaxID=365341 RepID=UPI00301659AE
MWGRMLIAMATVGLSGMVSGTALANDGDPCGAKMVCASSPQSVVEAIKEAGYKAVLSKSKTTGNPMIESAANGYDYSLFFYECEEAKQCGSLQFMISFADDGTNTPELANLWNKEKRFSQMAVTDDKSLAFSYDISTIGGLNQKNFADVVDWWALMLGEVSQFFKAQAPQKK